MKTMTTSSLPMGLIINSLVMPPVRLESALPPANWQASAKSIRKERDKELLCYVWQTIAGPIQLLP